jgi:uncharacterized protein (DUF1330 family)
MAAYLVCEACDISDPAAIEAYDQRLPEVVTRYGGRFLAHGGAEIVEGDHAPCGLAIIEFPSLALLHTFYASPEYAPLKQVRQGATTGHLLLIEGAPRPRSLLPR